MSVHIICPRLGRVPDAGTVSFANHFCSNSVNVVWLAWSQGESGLALGTAWREAGRDDGSEVQRRGYWHWQPQESSRASCAVQPGIKQDLQRSWWVLDAGDGVSRAARTAPDFGFMDSRRVLFLHREGCVPMESALCACS